MCGILEISCIWKYFGSGWSGWLGDKVRQKGMMRKFFILKEQKTILDVWHKRPEAIFTSGSVLATIDK